MPDRAPAHISAAGIYDSLTWQTSARRRTGGRRLCSNVFPYSLGTGRAIRLNNAMRHRGYVWPETSGVIGGRVLAAVTS